MIWLWYFAHDYFFSYIRLNLLGSNYRSWLVSLFLLFYKYHVISLDDDWIIRPKNTTTGCPSDSRISNSPSHLYLLSFCEFYKYNIVSPDEIHCFFRNVLVLTQLKNMTISRVLMTTEFQIESLFYSMGEERARSSHVLGSSHCPIYYLMEIGKINRIHSKLNAKPQL